MHCMNHEWICKKLNGGLTVAQRSFNIAKHLYHHVVISHMNGNSFHRGTFRF